MDNGESTFRFMFEILVTLDVQEVHAELTMDPKNIYSASLVPHFAMLQPISKLF